MIVKRDDKLEFDLSALPAHWSGLDIKIKPYGG